MKCMSKTPLSGKWLITAFTALGFCLASLAAAAQGNFSFPGMQSQTAPIPVNSGVAGPQPGDTAVAANSELINDYNNHTALIDSAFIKNVITFRLNEALPIVLSTPFTAQLTFKLYFTGKDGQVYDSTGSNLTLTINYDTAKGATYNISNSLVFYNGYRVKVKVVSITGVDASILKSLEIDNTVSYHNYYKFDCTNSAVTQINIVPPVTTGGAIPDELPVNWTAQPGVSGYDLEWTFVDSSAYLANKYGTPGTTAFYQNVFRNNATRVNLADTATGYALPLLSEQQGIVYIRVRSVQNIPNGRRMESDWRAYNSYGFGGHQANLNWQSSTAYAEEGKRKSVVQYYDGSLRSRQTVTKDNSTHTTVVAENFYDYQGRPVVQVLPAPTLNTLIQYTPQFNNINNGEYDKTHFDRSMAAYTCDAHADSMSSVLSGAAQYYSPNNPEKSIAFNQWLPDAKGYPYTEVKYLPDNTGRVAAQGGLGPNHQLGSGHETKYYYGSPDQSELDALFGTEAGYASHYFKNMVKDANGQYSVSYIDMHGRTIATALAGHLPDSIKLDALSYGKDSVFTKTLTDSTNNIVKDLATESSKSLMLTTNDNVLFTYTLPPSALVINNCTNHPVTYNCRYDLQITITDDCNNLKLGGQPYVYTSTGITSATPVSFTRSLPEGNYTITKKLSINPAWLAYYRDTLFMQNNRCKTVDSFVNDYIDSFKLTHSCGVTDCGTCLTALGSYASFRSTFISQSGWDPASITAPMDSTILAEYNRQVANCNLLCPKQPNAIDAITRQMLDDMTPPYGQYADSANIDSWSIFRLQRVQVGFLRYIYISPYQGSMIHYTDENGKPDTVYINGVPTQPNKLGRADFISNFKPSWANALLSLHPEYNRLQYMISGVSHASFDWDNDFIGTATFSDAYRKGYLNPTNNSSYVNRFPNISFPINTNPAIRDSFFIRNPTQTTLIENSMLYYYLSIGKDTASIWGIASGAGYCDASNNACVLSNKQRPFPDTSSCTGSANMAWKAFMSLYESKKSQQVQNFVVGGRPEAPPLETAFQTAAHLSRFEQGALTLVNDSLGLNLGDTSSQGFAANKAAVTAKMGGVSGCSAYASVWWSQLAPCTTSKLQPDSAAIINALIAVCNKGTDTQHPYGASSVAPGTSNAFASFDDVLAFYVNKYNQSHPDSINPIACNGELILFPQGYNAPTALVDAPVYKKPDSCQCAHINGLYTAYQSQSASYVSFSDYVNKNLGVIMAEATLDSLRNLCAGTITCYYLASPISLPPALQCGYTGSCVNCNAFQKWVDSFNVRYPGAAPSYDYSDSAQRIKNQLFTAYMNNKLGFNRRIDEYLAFIDSCHSANPSLANCASLTWTVYNPGTDLSVNADLYVNAENNILPVDQFFTNSFFNSPSSSLAGDYVLVDKHDSVATADSVVLMQWRVKFASQQDMVNPILQSGSNTFIGATWTKDPSDTSWLIGTTRVQVTGGVVKGPGIQSNSHTLTVDWVKITNLAGSVLFFNDFLQSAACQGNNLFAGPTLCPGVPAPLPAIVITIPTPCADSTNWAMSRATNVYNYYSDSVKGSFEKAYIGLCLQSAMKESFTATQTVDEYHYTLYYYDQAGNLVKTVPPAGVVRNYDPTWLQQVAQARASGQTLTGPAHAMVTEYRYNTINSVVTQKTPDAGQSNFWYDRLARLVLSQNAKQFAAGNNYSYTIYDRVGRIAEVGQVNNSIGTVMTSTTRTPLLWQQWLTNNSNNMFQVTTTVYDLPASSVIVPWLVQNPSTLRNQISYSSISPGQKGVQPVYTRYYNYDIEGNVSSLLNDYGPLSPMAASGQQYKRIDYQYDLVSGNINSVTYQAGKPDAFTHYYQYDAENFLTDVFSSADSVTIEHEAHYTYYKHGALARTLLGNNQVQGLDYAYTLEGWLKGVNSNTLSPTGDMGQDGNSTNQFTQYIARDAYGFSLHYFDGDYASITNTALFNGLKQQLGTAYKPLYNGNVSSMALNIGQFNSPKLYNYRYDQLNRLTGMDVFNGGNTATNLWDGGLTPIQDYKERVAYDPNGNILSYIRHGYGNTLPMDSLIYSYATGTNQLNSVSDDVPSTNYPNDIDSINNYTYDAIGNLINDQRAGIINIDWSVYGKINSIQRSSGNIAYQYDAAGNRISKNIAGVYTWYVRDAQGNVIAVYSGTGMGLQEQHLYGGDRLGMITNPATLNSTAQYLGSKLGSGNLFIFTRGKKLFELNNHLNSNLVTISDKKVGVPSVSNAGQVAYYNPDIKSATDMFPFGMQMPGRTYNSGGQYRYGFQGQEKDNEIKGDGDIIDFTYRVYDPRIGRFLSIDPLVKKYPFYSPYHFSSNQPIHAPELEGLESQFDLNIPSSPNAVDLNHWKLNTQFKAPNGTQWLDLNGNKLTFDRAQAGKPGFSGVDHWHFEDAGGNRYNAAGEITKSYGAKEAHLLPGTKTSIKVQASVTATEINGVTEKTTTTTPTEEEIPAKINGTIMKSMIVIDVVTTFTGIITGNPDAMINQFGSAQVGELRKGYVNVAGWSGVLNMYASYYMITNESILEWSENGVNYKTVTRTLQHFESKKYDKKQGRYVGDTPVGPQFQQTQKYKNGKIIDKGTLSAPGNAPPPA